jgi:hypothetical protein
VHTPPSGQKGGKIEALLIGSGIVKDHLFADSLSQLRKDAIRQAKETAVTNEYNQQRRM